MRWLGVVQALGAAATAQVAGTVSTCVAGEQRPVRGMEVYLFRGESARVVKDALVAMEQVDASDEAYRRAYDRLRQIVREQRGAKVRSDREGRFRFVERGELVVAMRVGRKKPEFDFAFVSEGPVELWVEELRVSGFECRGDVVPPGLTSLKNRGASVPATYVAG